MVELIVKICSHAPYTPLVLRGLACIFLGRMKTDIERRAGSGKSTLTFQNPSAQLCSAMAQLSPLTQYAELYVDSSRPSIQQAASVDAVAYLLKNDILTLEAPREDVLRSGNFDFTSDHVLNTEFVTQLKDDMQAADLRNNGTRTLIAVIFTITLHL